MVSIDTHHTWVEFPIFDAKARSLKKTFLGRAGELDRDLPSRSDRENVKAKPHPAE
jgi:hypothetical protein